MYSCLVHHRKDNGDTFALSRICSSSIENGHGLLQVEQKVAEGIFGKCQGSIKEGRWGDSCNTERRIASCTKIN